MSVIARRETGDELAAAWQIDLLQGVAERRVARTTCDTYGRGIERYMTWCGEKGLAWQEAESVEFWRASFLRQGLSLGDGLALELPGTAIPSTQHRTQ